MHRDDCINCETCYFCLIRLLYGRVLGAQTFTLLKIVNPFQVFVRVPELAGDARRWWQLGLCLCSIIEQVDQQLRFLLRYPLPVRRLTLFTDMLTVTCCSPFVHTLSNIAGAGQFMTDFLPLTAWSQVPPVSVKWCLMSSDVIWHICDQCRSTVQ